MPDSSFLDDYEKTGQVFSESEHAAMSVAAGLVRDSFLRSKEGAEEARRLEAERRLDAYEDDFAPALKSRISATYAKPNAEDLIKVIDTTNNPLKRIVNEVSTLYTKSPSRTLAKDSDTALWRDLIEQADGSVVFPRADRLTNLLNAVLVYVRPRGESLVLKLILPQDCTVWPDPDDPTMPLCVEFVECDPAAPNAEPIYHQWDRREGSAGYRCYNKDGKLIGKPLENPYKDASGRQIIPIFAIHREWPTWSFWDATSGRDLYELTLMVGLWETWINHLIRTDSIQQKWTSGLVDTTGTQVGGTTAMLGIRGPKGEAVSVGQFSSQSDWDGLGNQIKRKLENVLYNYGLVLADTRTSGDPTSGFALKIRSQGLRKIQKARIPCALKSERAFYRVFSTVHNFEINNPLSKVEGKPLPAPKDARPMVTFADVENERTVEEKAAELDMAEKRIRMGEASPITVYIEMHPEATEEEARAAIEKNRADTDSLEKRPEPPMMQPQNPPGPPAFGAPPQKPEDEEADESEDEEESGAEE